MRARRLKVVAPGTLAMFAALGTACSSATPAPTLAPIDAPPPLPAPSPLLGARWVDAGGATAIGPSMAGGGRLVLVGGRRAVVDASGVHTERAAAPEPLWDVVDVPVGDGHELVAAGTRAVYRLQDPLAAPIPIGRAAVARIGAGNGGVFVWSRSSDLPTFVDLSGRGGAAVATEEPLRAIAFRDARAGAAIFAVSGLAATTDGGATWRTVSGARDEPIRTNGLRRGSDGSLRAFVFSDGPDGEIDLDHATLAPLSRVAVDPKEPALLAWIRATGRDPLEVAAGSGLDAQGGALVASHGLLAKVDLRTGALAEMVEFARGKWMNPCSAVRAGQVGYVACSLSEGDGQMFDPFGVLRVHLDEAGLKLERPVVVRNGEAELRSSPSGGAMLLGACSADDDGVACVKQPDGKWSAIKGDVELAEHGGGPLSDGRVAFVRGLSDGEQAPDLAEDDIGRGRRLRVAALDRSGKEKTIALIGWEGTPGDLRVQSPIEEDDLHALHFVISENDVPYTVIVSQGKDVWPARRIPAARFARIHGGRGVAVGEAIQTTLDGGASWNRIDVPPRILDAMSRAEGPIEELTQVSDVGFRIGSVLRVGWGPAESSVEPPMQDPAPLAEAKVQAQGKEQILRCSTRGPGQSIPPPLGSLELKDSLASTTKPREGIKRETSSWTGSRWGMLDTLALLEVDSTQKPDAAHPDAAPNKPIPTSWSFRWLQPTAIGDHVRALTLPPPKVGETTVTGLRSANAFGDRALFTVRLGDKFVVVRASGAVAPEVREIAQELLPLAASDVVFGAGKGEPIAWFHDTSIVVWISGEAPRVVAELSLHGTRHLGEPSLEGIPLLVGDRGWTLFRILPIVAQAARVPLQGWTKLPFVADDPGDVVACATRPKGARVWVVRPRGGAEVDGVPEAASSSVVELRIDGAKACVASIASLLTPRSARLPDGKKDAKSDGGFAAFLRADTISGQAEGGDRGPPGSAKTRRLRCTLSP